MAYAGYLMRLRVDQELLKPEFLHWIMASPQLRDQIELPARSTSGVHNINTQEVRSLGVPFPSLDEQAEIVRRVNAILAAGDLLVAQIERTDDSLDRISRSILAKAFRGELVPTEAELAAEEGRDYETAEELLARVADS
jgi:type I restriction enzyme S subunit